MLIFFHHILPALWISFPGFLSLSLSVLFLQLVRGVRTLSIFLSWLQLSPSRLHASLPCYPHHRVHEGRSGPSLCTSSSGRPSLPSNGGPAMYMRVYDTSRCSLSDRTKFELGQRNPLTLASSILMFDVLMYGLNSPSERRGGFFGRVRFVQRSVPRLEAGDLNLRL